MKSNTLLITVATAALMAGSTLVSAQAPSGRDSSGAPSGGSQTQMSPSSPSSGQGGQTQQSPRSEQGRQGQTTGQSSPSQSSPSQSSPSERQGQSSPSGQRQGSESQPQQRQQGTSSQQQGASPSGSQSTQSGQQNRTGQTQSGSSTQQSQSAPSGGGAASANITTEQRTRIRETVLKTDNAPRVSRVDFSVSVGTAVPRTVKLAPVPTTIVEIQPAWRGYMFFIVGDQIVIVEPDTHKIIAVVAA